MFISIQSHGLIVAELRNQIRALLKAHEMVVAELRNQNVQLTKERDFYLKQWTKSRGEAFPSAKAEHSLPLFAESSVEQSAPSPLDADWTADDRDLFRDWAIRLPEGVIAEEEWKRLHGDRPPLLELTV